MDDFESGGQLPPQPRQLPSSVSKPAPRPTVTLGPPGPAQALPAPSTLPAVPSGQGLPASDASVRALAELADSISELVEISAETRDITLEAHEESTTQVAGESKAKAGAAGESVSDVERTRVSDGLYQDIRESVADATANLSDTIVEVGKVAHNPFVLVDKLFDQGLPALAEKIRGGGAADDDAFDPNRVLREMAGVRSEVRAENEASLSPLVSSLDGLGEVVASSPLASSLDEVGDNVLSAAVESSRPYTSQAVDPLSGSPDSAGGGGQGAVAILRQMSTSLRTLTMAGTKARPLYTYMLDLDNVAGEDGLYEAMSGGDGGFFGSNVTDIDMVGGSAGGRSGGGSGGLGGLGDAKWVAISAAIIALAGPIDKLVTAMADPNTGFGKMVSAMGELMENLFAEDGPILKLVDAITNLAVSVLEPLGNVIRDLLNTIGPPLVRIVGLLGDTLASSLEAAVKGMALLFNDPSEFFSKAASGIQAVFRAIFVDFVGEITAGIANAFSFMGIGVDEEQAEYLRMHGLSERQIRDVLKHGKDVRVDDTSMLEAIGMAGAGTAMLEVSWKDGKPVFHAVSAEDYNRLGNIVQRDLGVARSGGVDVTEAMGSFAFGRSDPNVSAGKAVAELPGTGTGSGLGVGHGGGDSLTVYKLPDSRDKAVSPHSAGG